MKNNDSLLSEGYRHYNNDFDDNQNKKNNQYLDISTYKYPCGIVPLILIILVEIIVALIAFLISKLNWYDALLIPFIIGFCLNIFWLIMRQNFALQTRYNLSKIKDIFTFKKYRKTRNLIKWDAAYNHINNTDDYIKFSKKRTKNSKIIFWSSFIFHTMSMIIVIVINLVIISH